MSFRFISEYVECLVEINSMLGADQISQNCFVDSSPRDRKHSIYSTAFWRQCCHDTRYKGEKQELTARKGKVWNINASV